MVPISFSILREHQKQARTILCIEGGRDEEEILQQALVKAALREKSAVRDGDYIRENVSKFPVQLEELRWKRTKDVIRRSMPGVDEDPGYLEIVARQTASIEMALRKEYTTSPDPKMSAFCDQVVVGTTPEFNPSAFSGPVGDRFVVCLSTGLMSFLFQAAKATVLSWRIKEPEPNTSVSLGTSTKDIEFVLKADSFPLELLYRTLWLYLFKGLPRYEMRVGGNLAIVGRPDPPTPREYVPALGWLISMSERFVIAHEYGHVWSEKQNLQIPSTNPAWQKEFEADMFAFLFTIISARQVDFIPANIALQGGFFALTALDVVRQAIDLVRSGTVGEDRGFVDHPPAKMRIEMLKRLYAREFLNEKDNQGVDLAIEGALRPSETLRFLWDRIQVKFREVGQNGRKVHPIWDSMQAQPTVGSAKPQTAVAN